MSKSCILTLLMAALAITMLPSRSLADDSRVTVQEGIAVGGAVCNSTITNSITKTINQENPTTLAMLAKAINDKNLSEDKRREAESKVTELATKWDFTAEAVAKIFEVVGAEKVPDKEVPIRLIEIASHFAQLRNEFVALQPQDPQAVELSRQANIALGEGNLNEANRLWGEAQEVERDAYYQARELKWKAIDAETFHEANVAQLKAHSGGKSGFICMRASPGAIEEYANSLGKRINVANVELKAEPTPHPHHSELLDNLEEMSLVYCRMAQHGDITEKEYINFAQKNIDIGVRSIMKSLEKSDASLNTKKSKR